MRQSEGASRFASVFMHEVDICVHGGHVHGRYLRGPGVECRLLEVPFCEYAMQGSETPHPALLVPPSTKRSYAVKVGVSTVRISEAPGVNIVHWRSHFCDYVVRGTPPPHPARPRVPKHQIHITLDGERVKRGDLRGPGVSSSV